MDTAESMANDGATAEPALLDSYSGYYQHSEYVVECIFRDGAKLHIRAATSTYPRDVFAAPELRPTSKTEFFLVVEGKASERHYIFEHDSHGAVIAMLLRHRGVELRFPRINESTAEKIKERARARIASNKPIPGSEAALRRLIEQIRANDLNYEELAPGMASLLRKRMPRLYAIATGQGQIRSLRFRGVGRQGWDVYDVECELGASRWRLLIGSDGRVADAIGAVMNAPAGLGP